SRPDDRQDERVLLDERRRAARPGPPGVARHRPAARLVGIHAHLFPAPRISRRARGFHPRGGQRRRLVLPLSQARAAFAQGEREVMAGGTRPRAAVIVTTYNRPDALAAVLAGYAAQDTLDFELLVADDGSTEATRALVEERARVAPFPLRHVWQEDRGFRPGAARNRALAATTADYIVFTDGDCVPPPQFVRRHRELAEPDC